MTVSHTERPYSCCGVYVRRIVLPGIAVAFLAVAPVAHAQTSGTGPVRLTPPVFAPAKTPPPSMAVGPPPVIPKAIDTGGAVEVDTLKTISPDTAGILSPEEGGFGPDIWLGSSNRLIETMLVRMPISVASTTMRDIMRRLLLTPATLPKGHSADGSNVVRRVGLLMEMGEVDSVSQLLDAIPGRDAIDQLVRYEADIRFLANDNARACALAAIQIGKFDNSYWQKAFIFCQTLAGERDKAALGVSLLREVGEQDEAFFTLVDRLSGIATPLESLPDPTPLQLSMARAAKVQLPADVVSSNRPGILRSIATSPNAPVEIRLEAAERAELAGALDVDTLRQLYTSVSFSEQALANPLSRAEAESGPLSRALLYRTALVQTVPTAQAEAAARALELAREGGRYPSTVRVFMPVLKKLPASTELAWFAPQAIRAFLIGGDIQSAQPWFTLLQAKALFDKDAVDALNVLSPLARLAGSKDVDPRPSEQLRTWWAMNKDSEDGAQKAALLYSLFEAMGEEVPSESWETLLDGPQQSTVVMPSPALWNRLQSATEAATITQPEVVTEMPPQVLPNTSEEIATVSLVNAYATPQHPRQRFGEALLLGLIALGEGGPGETSPIVLNRVIHGLRMIGLEQEARSLALEAAISAGL